MAPCKGREGLTLVPCQGAAPHRARLFPSFPGDLGGALWLSCMGNVAQAPDVSRGRDLGLVCRVEF